MPEQLTRAKLIVKKLEVACNLTSHFVSRSDVLPQGRSEQFKKFYEAVSKAVEDNDFGERPLRPGDTVKVVGNPRNKNLLGKTGTLVAYTNVQVEVDGKVHPLTTRSIELVE